MSMQRAVSTNSIANVRRLPVIGISALAGLLQLSAATAMAAAEVPAGDRTLTLTFYRGDVALVQDRRSADLPAGRGDVRWPGVARGLQPGSVRLDGDAAVLHGFTLVHEPWSLAGLVEAHLGREVRVVRGAGADREVIRARVIAADPLLLENVDGVFSAHPGQLVYPGGAPAGMGAEPALALELERAAGGRADYDLSYLAGGFGWSAAHVATLSPDGSRMDLVTRAHIDNGSGMDIEAARITLIAGQVNIPRDRPASASARQQGMVAKEAFASADVMPQAAGDQYRFVLPEPLTLADGASRTLRLRGHDAMPVERSYAVTAGVQLRNTNTDSGWQTVPVETRLQWEQPDGPLPAGPIRVYARADGVLRLVGGDHVPDRPEGAAVQIVPGRPFDLTARRRQTDFRRIDPRRYEVAHEIRLRNARDEAAEIVVEETIPGDWEMLDGTGGWERAAAHLVVWRVEVPAGAERYITYRVKIEM